MPPLVPPAIAALHPYLPGLSAAEVSRAYGVSEVIKLASNENPLGPSPHKDRQRGEPMPPEWYEIPVYYKSGHQNILGPGEDVKWPSFTERFDFELELAAVIGVAGRDVPAEAARAHIAGFLVMNGFSARDIQKKEMKVRLGPARARTGPRPSARFW